MEIDSYTNRWLIHPVEVGDCTAILRAAFSLTDSRRFHGKKAAKRFYLRIKELASRHLDTERYTTLIRDTKNNSIFVPSETSLKDFISYYQHLLYTPKPTFDILIWA